MHLQTLRSEALRQAWLLPCLQADSPTSSSASAATTAVIDPAADPTQETVQPIGASPQQQQQEVLVSLWPLILGCRACLT